MKIMKQLFNICLSLTLVIFIASCDSKPSENADSELPEGEIVVDEEELAKQEEHDEAGDHMHSEDHKHSEEQTVSSEDFAAISDDKAKEVVNAYLEIKNALVATNAEQAKEGAKKMLSNMEGAGSTQAVNGIKEDAEHIIDTDEMAHIREHFDLMSQNVYAMAKAKDIGMTLYKQYCPMAFNNEGAFWLSSEEEIRNPYFGDKMLKCGSVKETIASK